MVYSWNFNRLVIAKLARIVDCNLNDNLQSVVINFIKNDFNATLTRLFLQQDNTKNHRISLWKNRRKKPLGLVDRPVYGLWNIYDLSWKEDYSTCSSRYYKKVSSKVLAASLQVEKKPLHIPQDFSTQFSISCCFKKSQNIIKINFSINKTVLDPTEVFRIKV